MNNKISFIPELQFLYGELLKDIRDWKKHQWYVATSCISLQVVLTGAIAFIRQFKNSINCDEKWIFGIISCSIAIIGVIIILKLHHSNHKARERITKIEKFIPNDEPYKLNELFAGVKPDKYSKWYYGLLIPAFLLFIIIIASLVFCIFIIAKSDFSINHCLFDTIL